ncbi:Acyl- N-acyltransferase [Pyrenophora seminiperda CCB06]|uniref:Acyl-N-acyltransferase n=1 Tax=Pyrenophora seminiperda CCB06 TaxID=1302712 RepID=A0A3M7MEV3_9PLEO|nr:Acyl- N-acyltransferase [Pyrenophora seminiperda CCB06]
MSVADPDDSSRIAQLVQAAFNHLDIKWTGPDVELNRNFTVTPEEIHAIIGNSNAAFLMATIENGSFIGVVAVIKTTEDLARFALLAVDPTYQASGIGGHILEQAEDYAINTWDIKMFGLNAFSTRGLLIEWYEKRGYTITGEKSELPAKAVERLTLSNDLHFVEMEKQVETAHVVRKEQLRA